MLKQNADIFTDIREARLRLGVSLRVMATLLGVGPEGEALVAEWEGGKGLVPKSVKNVVPKLPQEIPYRDKNVSPCFRFIDLFAGVGGIRLPFQQAGGKCVFTAEWDKYSQITYAANFGDVPEKNGDITKFAAREIPDHDVLLAGFPCQAFSQAGLKQGFLDTRGTMFFEIQRILAEKRPRAFLLENVKQLRGHDGGRTLATIMAILKGEASVEIPSSVQLSDEAMYSLGRKLEYDVDFRVLRARDFGVPQIRERIYIVGILRDERHVANHARVTRIFDRVEANHQARTVLADILVDDSLETARVTISDKLWEGHRARRARNRANGKGFGYSLFTRQSDYCSTISARYYKDGSEILIDQSELNRNPRKLLPEEARALQGFPNNFNINMVAAAHIYKQFGNSVAVPVIRAIAEELLPAAGLVSKGN